MREKIYVWDPLVRLFHWSLVLSFIVAYVTGEDGEDPAHVYSGYIIMGLIVFRIVWGLIGSKHARFSGFITSPVTALRYGKDMLAGKARHYPGHNPLGGWMILALLLSLAITTVTGLKLYGIEGHGPWAQNSAINYTANNNHELVMLVNGRDHDDDDEYEDREKYDGKDKEREKHEVDEEAEEFWEEIHEFFANFTLLLVLLHITGVIISSARESQNLVKAMITGYKQQ
jgi:cytochrome b